MNDVKFPVNKQNKGLWLMPIHTRLCCVNSPGLYNFKLYATQMWVSKILALTCRVSMFGNVNIYKCLHWKCKHLQTYAVFLL